MSLADKREISFAEISRFLARHADFFVEHPELLQQIAIPHGDGVTASGNKVSSLLEYQVNHLQKRLRILEKDNTALKEKMVQQRDLAREIHALAIRVMQTRNVDELYSLLQKELKISYMADRLVLLVFDRSDMISRHADMRFLHHGTGMAFMFTEIFHSGKPLCNSLQEEHLEALFRYGTEDLQSTVLLPMTGKKRRSLMVLGSCARNRYQHGNELDLLLYVSQVVNNQLCNLVQ